MRKLRRRRCLQLFMVVAAMAVVAVAPAGARAGEESSGGSTGGEAGTESSSGSTGSAPPAAPEEAPSTTTPPPSTGWVPQGTGNEASSDEAASTRRGSSLGSGASSKQSGSTSEQAGSTSEGSSYSGSSSGYYEPEPSTPSTSEEPASRPHAASPVDPVKPQPVAEPNPAGGGHAAVGVATPVTLPVSPQVADASTASLAASVEGTRDRVASGSGSLPLPVLIVGLLILVYAGVRLLLGPVEPDLFRSGRFQRVRRAISRV